MIFGNKSRAKLVLIGIELSDTSYIAMMLHWINKVGNPTVVNEQHLPFLYAVE